jgi:predicted nucleic acid-binding protein
MTAPPNTYFLDSNIWIYAFAHSQDPRKQTITAKLIDSPGVIISTQVINEVSVNLIKNPPSPKLKSSRSSTLSTKAAK